MAGYGAKTLAAAVFTGLLVYLTAQTPLPEAIPEANTRLPLRAIGDHLFTQYGEAVIVVALILVAATLGAVFLAKEEPGG